MYKGSRINSPLKPSGQFPAVWDDDFGGGYRVVTSLADLTAIPLEKIKLGMVVYVINESLEYRYINTLTQSLPDTFTQLPTSNTLIDWDIISDNVSLSASIIDTTYSGLITLINTSALQIGNYYRITDFNTTWKDYYTVSTFAYGAIEPLIVQAIGVNMLSIIAYSETYPYDIIYLQTDVLSPTHVLNGATQYTGKIIYRRDTLRDIETYYDWRQIKIRKWSKNTGLDYDLPYPYQRFVISNYPVKSIKIDVTQWSSITTTLTINPNRILKNIYDIACYINAYFCSINYTGQKAEVINDLLYIYHTDFIYSGGIQSLWSYSNLQVQRSTDSVWVLCTNDLNNYPGGVNDDSFTFLTFDQNRTTTSSPINSNRCKSISINKLNTEAIALQKAPTIPPTVGIIGTPTVIETNPLGINNICFNNTCQSITINSNSSNSVIDSCSNIIFNGYNNSIKNTTNMNIDGFHININRFKNSNINGNHIYGTSPNTLYVSEADFNKCSWITIGDNCINIQLNTVLLFTDIGSNWINRSIINNKSDFYTTPTINTIGPDSTLTISCEWWGELLIDSATNINIIGIITTSNTYRVPIKLKAINSSVVLNGNSVLLTPLANSIILSSNTFTLINNQLSYIILEGTTRSNVINWLEIDTKTYL